MLVLDNVSNLILEVGRQNVTDRAVSSIKTRGSKVVTHLATAINDKSNRKQSLNLAGREFNRTGKAIGQYLKQKARGVSNLGHEVFLTPLDKNYSSRVKAAVVNPNERIDDMKTIRLTKKHLDSLHKNVYNNTYLDGVVKDKLNDELNERIKNINKQRVQLKSQVDNNHISAKDNHEWIDKVHNKYIHNARLDHYNANKKEENTRELRSQLQTNYINKINKNKTLLAQLSEKHGIK